MSKLKQKRPSRSLAQLRQATRRRFNFDPIEEPRETIVFLPLKDHEFKWLKKLARRHDTSLEVEIHRAIDTHIRSDGQPYVRLLNDFLNRLNTSFNWHNKLLEEALQKTMKTRASYAQKPRQSRSATGRRR